MQSSSSTSTRRPLLASCALLLLALVASLPSSTPAAATVAGGKADATSSGSGELEFVILHNNDMHARFEQTGQHSNTCQPSDVIGDKCYGGFARVSSKLKEYREKAKNGGEPVLYLNAGDTYTGTPWFTLYKDKIVAEFLNLLKPDAISLGNHEFDNNVAGLVPFLEAAHFPVLIANLDASSEPQLAAAKALKKSTIFSVNGVQVGVIGYLTPETKDLAPDNEVRFTDEVAAINAEAAELKRAGVNILIGLGHSGLERDQQIAAQCPDLDLVVGGHSHTFLYTGAQPDAETAAGPYPVWVTRKDGTRAPVVQAYAFTKYLGYMKLRFDAAGRLTDFNGAPILLDHSVPRDPAVLEVLAKYRPGIESMQREVVARTLVFMNGTCRVNECNTGNFIADSMVWQRAAQHTGEYWTDAAIAFVQGGGVRSSLSVGNITVYDLTTLMPFENNLVVLEVNGTEILEALEHSVYRYDGVYGWGEFLQMSGVRVEYNVTRPPLQRVVSVEVLCASCEVPAYAPLQTNGTVYRILVSSFLNTGGDGFEVFRKPRVEQLPGTEKDATEAYLRQLRIVYPAVEWRIKLTGEPSAAAAVAALWWTVLVAAVAVVMRSTTEM